MINEHSRAVELTRMLVYVLYAVSIETARTLMKATATSSSQWRLKENSVLCFFSQCFCCLLSSSVLAEISL